MSHHNRPQNTQNSQGTSLQHHNSVMFKQFYFIVVFRCHHWKADRYYHAWYWILMLLERPVFIVFWGKYFTFSCISIVVLQRLLGHENICSCVKFRPKSPWSVVTGGLDCMLILWDFKKEKVSIFVMLHNTLFCSRLIDTLVAKHRNIIMPFLK